MTDTTQKQWLSQSEQREYSTKLMDHKFLLMSLPCSNQPNHPFEWSSRYDGVEIIAVVERFDKNAQYELVRDINNMLNCTYSQPSLINFPLMAKLDEQSRPGSGYIKLELKEVKGRNEIHKRYQESLLQSPLWAGIGPEYLDRMVIDFRMDPFGETTATRLTFTAGVAVPLFVMMYILHKLHGLESGCEEESHMGAVSITDTNGLPNKEDWLHLGSGLFKWCECE